jgi:formamidopyrimidine-DNA glycosylase
MPELPEVETVRRTLEQLVIGKKITDIQILWGKIIKKPDDSEEFKSKLIGETFKGIGRRGKFLLFYLSNYTLVSHLRMEGRFGVFSKEEPIDKHTHVIFALEGGTELRYRDVRKFGTMHVFPHGEELNGPPLAGLGPEPFSDSFTVKHLAERLKKTERKIKVTLLDQRIVVGLGNIYVDEALHRAGIHPERKANSLKRKEIIKLHEEVVATLSEAVAKGGSTIRSYVNSQGQIGLFQLELFVYGRKGEACKRCGDGIEKIKLGGRGTHFCKSCQT